MFVAVPMSTEPPAVLASLSPGLQLKIALKYLLARFNSLLKVPENCLTEDASS